MTFDTRAAHTRFNADDGTVYTFDHSSDVDKFAHEESLYWAEMLTPIGDDRVCNQFDEWMQSGFDLLRECDPRAAYENQAEEEELFYKRELFKRIMNAYGSGRLPSRGSELARELELIGQHSEGIEVKSRTLDVVRNFIQEPLHLQELKDKVDHSDVNDDLKSEIGVARDLIKRLNIGGETAADILAHSNEAIEKYEGMVEAMKREAAAASTNAASAVTDTIILKKPAEYWSKKRAKHNWGWWIYLVLFVAAIGLAIYFIPSMAHERLTAIEGVDIEPWTFVFLEVGAPALLFLWLVRTVAKLFTREQSLRDDAAERVTMMNVYLSLTAKGELEKEDRHLMIRALFRPVEAPAHDEPMPGWIDTLIDRGSRSSGG